MELGIIKVFGTFTLAFISGIAITPFVAHILYTHKMWKKKAGKQAGYGGGATPIFNALHKDTDTGVPRMGGSVIWLAVLITIAIISAASALSPHSIATELDFLSRSQTWLPLTALLLGAAVGLVDDYFIVKGAGKHFSDGGLSLSLRLAIVAVAAAFGGYWFYAKLGVTTVSLLGFGELMLDWMIIPFFMLVALAVYASGIIDGIDGLSGGVFLFIFSAYTGIALMHTQYDLAAFTAAVAGGILAFLWFNIPPARFYMTETGIMALTLSLTVVAFMTDTLVGSEGVSLLPIIGSLLVLTVASNILQIFWKKVFKRKLFLIAPLHHHFEALGWPRPKVVMRYWVVGFISAVLGILLSIIF